MKSNEYVPKGDDLVMIGEDIACEDPLEVVLGLGSDSRRNVA